MPNTSLHPTCITKAYNRTGLGLLPCPTGKLSPVPQLRPQTQFCSILSVQHYTENLLHTCWSAWYKAFTKDLLGYALQDNTRVNSTFTHSCCFAPKPQSFRESFSSTFIKKKGVAPMPGVAPMFFTTEQPVKS